jgi:hypothetical protein
MTDIKLITIYFNVSNEDMFIVFDGKLYDLDDCIAYVLERMPNAKLIDYRIE